MDLLRGYQELAGQGASGGHLQHAPEVLGRDLAHAIKLAPEITIGLLRLIRRWGELHLGTLVPTGGLHISPESILCGLHRIGPLWTEEVHDVLAEQPRIGAKRVEGFVVFRGRAKGNLQALECLPHGLDLLQGVDALVGLGDEGILDRAGVPVQQGGGFGAEVLEHLEALIADAA